MRIYQNRTVWKAALDRFRWLYDEFGNIVVNFSGGKDSTVCLNLALMVAEEKGRLPVDVLFIDQEAEWRTVIEYVRTVMADPRVNPLWLQVPFKIFNATSTIEPWLHCWEPGREWVREKEPISIKDNRFGVDRFGGMFNAFADHHFQGGPYINIAGVRCEESPARALGLTSYATYKHITWGKKENARKQQYTMYPLYDWSYTDIWKAIHDNGWAYCRIYDYMCMYGVPIMEMRVSNVHHETAVKTLYYLQEIEQDTWNRITARIGGLNTAKTLREDFMAPKALPWMFRDWREYREHLLENLIADPEIKATFRKEFDNADKLFDREIHDALWKYHVGMVLKNNHHPEAMRLFQASHGQYTKGSHHKARKRREKPPDPFAIA